MNFYKYGKFSNATPLFYLLSISATSPLSESLNNVTFHTKVSLSRLLYVDLFSMVEFEKMDLVLLTCSPMMKARAHTGDERTGARELKIGLIWKTIGEKQTKFCHYDFTLFNPPETRQIRANVKYFASTNSVLISVYILVHAQQERHEHTIYIGHHLFFFLNSLRLKT